MNSSLHLKAFLLLLGVVFCAAADPIRATPRTSWSIADSPTARPVQLTNAAISSEYNPPHPASEAIDGSLSTYTHTSLQYEAWFQVSTVFPTVVSQIVIYNRQDCCQDRFNLSFVFIKATPFIGTTINQIAQEPGVTFAIVDTIAQIYTIDYSPNVQASYVRIMHAGTQILNFAEIFVLTNAVPAEIASAEMSSDYPASPHPASEAIDGNVNTFCHTNFGNQNWLKINLQQSVNAVQVEIVNRLDSCCKFRINPGYVFLKNTPFIGDTIDEISTEPGVVSRFILTTQDYYNFYLSGVPVTYVWIFQYSSSEPLNIAEVYVF